MNLEEAKENIGKEVVLDESTKPYKYMTNYGDLLFVEKNIIKGKTYILISIDNNGNSYLRDKDYSYQSLNIRQKHLKLKEKSMNYKIQVTPETSEEVQRLFFELGYQWRFNDKDIMEYTKYLPNIFAFNGYLYSYVSYEKISNSEEITVPQLRDLVVLKRNDVSDATHAYKNDNKEKYYIGHSVYRWNDSCWKEIALNETYISGWLELIGDDTQMTWQDALRAVADGKKIEALDSEGWQDIVLWEIQHLENAKSFRIAPQRITLHNSYTKEELLKIAGEME